MRSMLASIVVVSVLVVAAASASASTPLKPPVIHEPFTVLPCPTSPSMRDTTIGMEGCEEHLILKSDAKINTLASQILGQLPDRPAQLRFLAGEKAWLAYRGAFCNSQSDIFEGGSQAPVEYAGCVVHLNTQHVADLTEFHHDLAPH